MPTHVDVFVDQNGGHFNLHPTDWDPRGHCLLVARNMHGTTFFGIDIDATTMPKMTSDFKSATKSHCPQC